ncbi:unnamed protein product [Vicia faba]|uniref:Transmembrane protein n=1 Tax=Vicia faba TaxID=3906 RepID=A0AAV1B7R0_VICFA|nr:unnamed protein product [Vicia faba]
MHMHINSDKKQNGNINYHDSGEMVVLSQFVNVLVVVTTWRYMVSLVGLNGLSGGVGRTLDLVFYGYVCGVDEFSVVTKQMEVMEVRKGEGKVCSSRVCMVMLLSWWNGLPRRMKMRL